MHICMTYTVFHFLIQRFHTCPSYNFVNVSSFIYLFRGGEEGEHHPNFKSLCVIQFASERCFARFKNMNFSQPTGHRLQKTCFFQRVLLRYSFLNLFSLPCIFLRIYFLRIATEQERYIIAVNLLVLENTSIIILFKKSEIFDGEIQCKYCTK